MVNSGSMLNWWIGSIFIRETLGPPAWCRQSKFKCCDFRQRSALARSHARRPHHVDHAGNKAEQEEHDEPERRCRQQAVEPPANHRPDYNARDQFRGKTKTERHRRGSGSTVSAFSSGLISPDLPVVT